MTKLSDAPPPPEIPDYELLRCIGQGSYGDVWLAQTATGVFRAVKVVWRDRFPDPDPYEREFRGLREFEKVSLVQPRQLALLHVARRDEDGYFYYVMELADDVANGREIVPATYQPFTLGEFRRRGAMEVARVVELGVELARGLAVLHDHGLVHRDIKPSNVVMVGGVPKLADVGLVAASTMALTFVGTEGFVAPEGPGTPGSDVFALGKVLFELVTGMDRKVFPRLPDNFEQRPDRVLFLELNAVIVRACDPDRSVRHEHARSLLDDLLLVQAGKSVRRLRSAERGLARALKVAAGLALVAAVAGAGAWVAWDRAQAEMALRAEAEAQRDALARQKQYAGLLAQASRALERKDAGFARTLLERARTFTEGDEAPFEWKVLRTRADGDVDQFLRKAGPPVRRLALSPDETELTVFDGAGKLVVIGAEDGAERMRLLGAGDFAGYSLDGNRWWGVDRKGRPSWWSRKDGAQVSASYDGAVLWALGVEEAGSFYGVERLQPGRVVSWDGDGAVVEKVRLLPDDGLVWDLFRAASDQWGNRGVVAWVNGRGPAAKFLVTAWRGKEVWRTLTSVRPGGVGWFDRGQNEAVVEWANDLNGEWAWWQPGEGRTPKTDEALEDHSGVRIVGTRTGEYRRAIGARWDLVGADGQVRSLRGLGGNVSAWAASADGVRAFSGSEAGDVVRWRAAEDRGSNEVDQTLNDSDHWAAFAQAGRRLLIAGQDGGVRVFAARTLVEEASWSDMRWPVLADDRLVWGVDVTGRELVACDESTGEILVRRAAAADAAPIQVLAMGNDRRSIAYLRAGGSLWVERLNEGETRRVESVSGYRWGLNVDRAVQRLWCTGRNTMLECHDLETGTMAWSVTLPTTAADAQLTPDERAMAVALINGKVLLLDADTGRTLRTLDAGAASAESVGFSPSGDRLFVGGNDGAVHVFETDNWSHLVALETGRGTSLTRMTIAPDGETIAVFGSKGRLALLRTESGQTR